MKGQFLVSILIVILIAFLCANFVYERYRQNYETGENVYLLQQGVYTDRENIKSITANYITVEQDHKYYTYLAMTTEKENAEKIKQFYEKQNIPVYIKKEKIQNQEFLSALTQYDVLLKNTDNDQEINNILETVLSTYEEILKIE